MRRRGNNEGSIYQTTDGRWRAAVVLADGRRKYVSAKTREGVVQRLRLVQRRNEDGLPISTDGASLPDCGVPVVINVLSFLLRPIVDEYSRQSSNQQPGG